MANPLARWASADPVESPAFGATADLIVVTARKRTYHRVPNPGGGTQLHSGEECEGPSIHEP